MSVKRYTTQDVAEIFGVDRSTVCRWARKEENRLASRLFGNQLEFTASAVRRYKPTPTGHPVN